MFFRIIVASTLVLGLSLRASAHASITPMLGVSGKPTRNDVQRPSKASECGNVNIGKTIDSSTPVQAAADGTFNVTVVNFNGGKDGSRKVTLSVDIAGDGKTFNPGTVSKNGDSNPNSVGSESIVAALPAGAKCAGGASKDLCLASFATTSGFGNCVVVKQTGSDSGSTADSSPADDNTEPPPPPVGVAGAKSISISPSDNSLGGAAVGQGNKGKGAAHRHHANATMDVGKQTHNMSEANVARFAAGTRAPRAHLGLKSRRAVAGKRGTMSWIWA